MIEYFGVPVFESKYVLKKIEDWSGCRSIPRARRRHAKGIKTRMVERDVPAVIKIGDKYFAHPVALEELKKSTKS